MLNLNTVAMVKTSNQLQQDTTVNTVMKTNDYSKFKSKDGNRNLNQLHLKRLTESVKQNDLLHANPILINEKYEIIDGQHRFNVCRQLNKPVHYVKVKGLGLSEIQILNANSKNWKSEDYIDGYCSMGMSEYCYLNKLLSDTKLTVNSLLNMFATDDGESSIKLKNGELVLHNKKRGLIILQWLKDWEGFYEGTNRRSFIRALVYLYGIGGYDHKKMMNKMKYQSPKLVHTEYMKTYLAMLEEIYNFKERNEKLRFF
jgi:hypothetical protein